MHQKGLPLKTKMVMKRFFYKYFAKDTVQDCIFQKFKRRQSIC